MKYIYELINEISINVLFIAILISVFYFTYGVTIEEVTIVDQMDILANDIVNTFKLTGNTLNNNLNNYLNNTILTPTYINNLAIEAGDSTSLAANIPIIKKVKNFISIFIIIILIMTVFFVITKKISNIKIKNIIIEALIVLVFIGLTEYSFLTFFGAKFISINPNTVKMQVFKDLQKYSKTLKK